MHGVIRTGGPLGKQLGWGGGRGDLDVVSPAEYRRQQAERDDLPNRVAALEEALAESREREAKLRANCRELTDENRELRAAVKSLADEDDQPCPSLKRICRDVAKRHGMSKAQLLARGRSSRLTAARMEFYYLAAMQTVRSLPEIGRFANRDHTTVLSGIRRYAVLNRLPLPRGMTLGNKFKALEAA